MRRSQIISIAIVLAGIVLAVVLHRPRMLPVSKCSPVYREYYKTPGINAAYIKSYPLNDSIDIAVTILEATDSAAWDTLLHDFSFSQTVIEHIHKSNKSVFSKLTPKGHYDQLPDSLTGNNDMIIVYPQVKSIYVLDLKSEEHLDAIVKYKQQKLIEDEKENNSSGMSCHSWFGSSKLSKRAIGRITNH